MLKTKSAAVQDNTAPATSGAITFDLQLFNNTPPVGEPPTTPPTNDPPASPPAAPPATPQAAHPAGDPAKDPAKDPNQTPPGAPEQYADFTIPEGFKYDRAMHETFSSVAKKHNLSQEAAQEIVSMYAGIKQQELQALISEHEQRVQGWVNEAKADPVIAKNFEQNLAAAKEAYKLFGGDELLQLLEDTGFGSHPLFIKMGMQLRAKISEDNFAEGGIGQATSVASLLYPSMVKK